MNILTTIVRNERSAKMVPPKKKVSLPREQTNEREPTQ